MNAWAAPRRQAAPSASSGATLAAERRADVAADAVLAGRRPPALGGAPRTAGADERLQARPDGPGRAVVAPLAAELSGRFGHDFAQVRVHDDARAAAQADALGARAYTLGEDIVFGAGQYRPGHPDGRRLLAHELAHVVQQRGNGPVVQREDKPGEGAADKDPAPAAKLDVSIVLTDEDQDLVEGRTYAKTALRVTDVKDAAAQLKALGAPIGTLYVVSHSSHSGEVQFVGASGTVSWVPIRDLAAALKGQVRIDTVDFRGCNVGNAGAELASFRGAVGAQSAKGSTCYAYIQHVTPLTLDGAEITRPDQIPKGRQEAFNRALMRQLQGMRSEDGKPVADCLLGLKPGERATRKNLDKVWRQYWANAGHLIASWGSPDYNATWQEGSICTNHMTASTKPCAVVEKTAPAASRSSSSAGSGHGAPQVVPGAEVAPAREADR